jgi:hypothetical protein
MSSYIWSGYRTPTDANDQLIWTLNESASPWANTGAYGTANLTAIGSPTVAPAGGFDGNGCVRFPGSGVNLIASGDSICELAYPITLSCWVALNAQTPNWGTFVCKNWATATWAAPYKALYINLNDQQNGSWQCGITFAGAARGWDFGNSDGKLRLDTGVWHFLGISYDGANMKAYMNGQLVGSLAETRAIDYGSHGRWQVGQGYSLSSGGDQLNGWVDDIRFANVARNAQWFNDVWSKGQSYDAHLLTDIGGSNFYSADKFMQGPDFDASELLGISGANFWSANRYTGMPAYEAESWGMPGPGFMGVTLYYAHRAWRISTNTWHFWNHTAPDPTGFYSGVSPSDLQDISIVRTFTK